MEEQKFKDGEWVCSCGTYNHKDFTYCVSCEKLREQYNLNISEKGVLINSILINEKILQEELYNYSVVEREDQIDHLIDWISEAKDRPSDLYLMKEDLKYLIGLKDNYIFSSIESNEFIAKSDDEKRFNKICKDLLKLNKQ